MSRVSQRATRTALTSAWLFDPSPRCREASRMTSSPSQITTPHPLGLVAMVPDPSV